MKGYRVYMPSRIQAVERTPALLMSCLVLHLLFRNYAGEMGFGRGAERRNSRRCGVVREV